MFSFTIIVFFSITFVFFFNSSNKTYYYYLKVPQNALIQYFKLFSDQHRMYVA